LKPRFTVFLILSVIAYPVANLAFWAKPGFVSLLRSEIRDCLDLSTVAATLLAGSEKRINDLPFCSRHVGHQLPAFRASLSAMATA